MPILNQRGIAHIVLIFILLAGIAGGVYLVQEGPKIFKPKALEPRSSSPETSFKLINAGSTKDEVVVKLYARSDISAANVFSAKINFPKDSLELTSIDVESKVSSISKGPPSLVTEAYAAAKKGGSCEHDSDCDSGLFCPGNDTAQRLGIPRDICAKEESKNVSGSTAIGGECKWDGDCKAPAGEKRGYCCTAENCGTRQYKCTNKDGTIPGSGAAQSGTAGSPRSVNLSWSEKTAVGDANRDGIISLVAQAQDPVKTSLSQDSLLLATLKFKIKKQEGEAKIEFGDSSKITTPSGVDLQPKKEGLTIQLGPESTSTPEPTTVPSATSVPSQPTIADPLACKNNIPQCGTGLTCIRSSCQSSCGLGKFQCWSNHSKGIDINCCNQINDETQDTTASIKVEPTEIKIGDTYEVSWSNGSTDQPDTIRLTEDSGSQWTIFTTSCDQPTQGDFRDISRSSPKRNGQCQFNGGEEQVLTFQLVNNAGVPISNTATLTVKE